MLGVHRGGVFQHHLEWRQDLQETQLAAFLSASLFSTRGRLKSQLQQVLMGHQAFPLVCCFNFILCALCVPVSQSGNKRALFDRFISSLRFVSSAPTAWVFFLPLFDFSREIDCLQRRCQTDVPPLPRNVSSKLHYTWWKMSGCVSHCRNSTRTL